MSQTRRIKCTVSYDGTNFFGFQKQVDKRTVQGEIEKCLSTIHKEPCKIVGSGRTDAQVHAYGQVFHFDTHLDIKEENWKNALNALLPNDIYIREVEKVDNEFHARYSVKKKEYRYYLTTAEYNPLRRNYISFLKQDVDIDKMREALKHFEGTHDFTSFTPTNNKVKDKVRTIYETHLNVHDKDLEFIFIGNGFLQYQVRIMMGLIIEIGLGKKEIELIDYLFEHHERFKAEYTAPPQGLYLWKAYY